MAKNEKTILDYVLQYGAIAGRMKRRAGSLGYGEKVREYKDGVDSRHEEFIGMVLSGCGKEGFLEVAKKHIRDNRRDLVLLMKSGGEFA